MADATYYVDYDVAEGSGTGTTGDPWGRLWDATFSFDALGGGHSAGDTLTVLVRNGGGAGDRHADKVFLQGAKHLGLNYVIRPDSGHATIFATERAANEYPIRIDSAMNTGSLDVTDFNWTGAVSSGAVLLVEQAAALTLTDVSIVPTKGTSIGIYRNGAAGALTLTNVTLDDVQSWILWGDIASGGITIDGCTFTADGDTASRDMLVLSEASTVTITDNTFTMVTADMGAHRVLDYQPDGCSAYVFTGNTVDTSACTTHTADDLRFKVPDQTSSESTCSLVCDDNVVISSTTAGRGLQFVDTGGGATSAAHKATLYSGSKFWAAGASIRRNRVESTFGAMSVGVGFEGAIIEENVLLGAGGAHIFNLTSDDLIVRGNIAIGSITLTVFGQNGRYTANTIIGNGTGAVGICGISGASTWAAAQGNVIKGNTFISPTGANEVAAWAYNLDPAEVCVNDIDYNRYVRLGGTGPAVTMDSGDDDIDCETLAEIVAAWGTFGTGDNAGNVGNDVHSKVDAGLDHAPKSSWAVV